MIRVALIFVFLATAAIAADLPMPITGAGASSSIHAAQVPCDHPVSRDVRIASLAQRLGVAPVDTARSGAVVLLSCDRKTAYDLFDIIDALLDRMDGPHQVGTPLR